MSAAFSALATTRAAMTDGMPDECRGFVANLQASCVEALNHAASVKESRDVLFAHVRKIEARLPSYCGAYTVDLEQECSGNLDGETGDWEDPHGGPEGESVPIEAKTSEADAGALPAVSVHVTAALSAKERVKRDIHALREEEAALRKELDEKNAEVEERTELSIGLMLLGAVAFVMSLFSLVNYPDQDMRYYVWQVISSTISIFVAVLLFQAMNTVVHTLCDHLNLKTLHSWVDFVQMIVYQFTLELVVALIAGVLEDVPYARVSEPTEECSEREYRKLYLEGMQRQIAQRQQTMKCWAVLLEHMTGFACINFGGVLQHGTVFQSNAPLTFMVVPIIYLSLAIIFHLLRVCRICIISRVEMPLRYELGFDKNELLPIEEYDTILLEDPEKYGRALALRKWDEAVHEAETSIAALAVSFLTVQACRFNITGVMPDSLGIEEEHYVHSYASIAKLSACTVAFAVLTTIYVQIQEQFTKDHSANAALSIWTDFSEVMKGSLAMSFAWALLYAAKWGVAMVECMGSPNVVHSRVLLAIIISGVAFLVILGLDKIADMPCTNSNTDHVIFSIITALGVLVGFAWEQSFDGGLEVISELTSNPVAAELGLALGVAAIVITPWRKYILVQVITLEKLWEEKNLEGSQCEVDSTSGNPWGGGGGSRTADSSPQRDSCREVMALGHSRSGGFL
eukprot:NODE_2022_length_2310_cov_5.063674.p1 GENE.NODE_2022_length_2310_cov_5.063674~~NODE_2022_length_2310_cov_5.063674.p1  ORF type:complete len:696 (+),score=126.44 NODE_2022_length_2310_cov_5.063674:35-2089(+)